MKSVEYITKGNKLKRARLRRTYPLKNYYACFPLSILKGKDLYLTLYKRNNNPTKGIK